MGSSVWLWALGYRLSWFRFEAGVIRVVRGRTASMRVSVISEWDTAVFILLLHRLLMLEFAVAAEGGRTGAFLDVARSVMI